MLTRPDERICLVERRHVVVLAGAFARALPLTAAGVVLLLSPWPFAAGAPLALGLAALLVLRAVWRWDRTRVVVTTEKLYVVHGTLRRRAAAVRLSGVGAVELEQGVAGRLLGYGTLIAGELEIPYLPRPRRIHGLVERLSG